MSYTIGDGMVSLALAGGLVGYIYLKNQERQKRFEIVHQERMVAMEKGIPLPEFPFEPAREPSPESQLVVPLLGLVLTTLSLGAMIVIYLNASASASGFWISPLPFTFLGVGLLAFHFLKPAPRR